MWIATFYLAHLVETKRIRARRRTEIECLAAPRTNVEVIAPCIVTLLSYTFPVLFHFQISILFSDFHYVFRIVCPHYPEQYLYTYQVYIYSNSLDDKLLCHHNMAYSQPGQNRVLLFLRHILVVSRLTIYTIEICHLRSNKDFLFDLSVPYFATWY